MISALCADFFNGLVDHFEQIAFSQTPGFNSVATEQTIAYTNVQVTGGLGELPMRVAPDRSNLSKLDPLVAQGIYIPSPGLVHALSTQDFDEHEFNIKQIDRAFNHGASQSDTKLRANKTTPLHNTNDRYEA